MKKANMICIIDDDYTHVFITKKTLEHHDISEEIIVYHNGKEAYDNLREMCHSGETLPELILLDLNMPIWDGWNFLDEFTKMDIKQKVTIYIVTSSVDPLDVQKSKKYKLVTDILTKPISAEKLVF